MNKTNLAAYQFSRLSTRDKKWVLRRLDKQHQCLLKTKTKELKDLIDIHKLSFRDWIALDEAVQEPEKSVSSIEAYGNDELLDGSAINEEFATLMTNLATYEKKQMLDNLSDYVVALLLIVTTEQHYLLTCEKQRRFRIQNIIRNLHQPLTENLENCLKYLFIKEYKRD